MFAFVGRGYVVVAAVGRFTRGAKRPPKATVSDPRQMMTLPATPSKHGSRGIRSDGLPRQPCDSAPDVDHNGTVFTIDPDAGGSSAQVVELDLGVRPSPAGSGELLLHGDRPNAYLVLLAVDRNYQRLGPAIITFVGCRQSLFGYPNDEARWGDQRLRDHDYGIFEIHDSSWRARLQDYNRQAFPHGAPDTTSRHFLVTCHESTVQVLARDAQAEVWPDPFENAVAEVLRRMLD
jgi:hypothetical protein